MIFPDWVEFPLDQQPMERAKKRLRFMLNRAAILTVPECTIRALAKHCHVDRTMMHQAIAAGRCGPKLATMLETALGRDVLCHEHLLRPLEIEATL